jgi:hypothetical protein
MIAATSASVAGQRLLVAAAWADQPSPAAGDATLAAALRLARRNQVEGRLARAYPERLAGELTRVQAAAAAFRRNLLAVAGLLWTAGAQPLLIKADLVEDYVYSNFDLVVGDDRWGAAVDALRSWGTRTSGHWLEPDKLLVHPADGPAAHLHRSVSWFGVPIIPTERLRARARPAGRGDWWVPAPADALRITLAHALFQNLSLDLSELLTLRGLAADGGLVQAARSEAATEGWRRGFDVALAAASAAMDRLDAGETIPLPWPLATRDSLLAGVEHAGHLARRTRLGLAGRELALRVPLLAAKRRRLRVG